MIPSSCRIMVACLNVFSHQGPTPSLQAGPFPRQIHMVPSFVHVHMHAFDLKFGAFGAIFDVHVVTSPADSQAALPASPVATGKAMA